MSLILSLWLFVIIAELVELMIQRKSNSLRKDELLIRFLKEQMRKEIETCFSEIKALFLRKIHGVTFKWFLLKLVMLILAFTLHEITYLLAT